MSNSKRIQELETQIKYHNDLYWNNKGVEISDVEYDNLVRELEKLDPENELIHSFGSENLSSEKLIAEITIPMSVVLNAEDNKITSFKNLINGDDVKVNISLKNRTMNLRIAPYGIVWLKLN